MGNELELDTEVLSASIECELNRIEGYKQIWEEHKKELSSFFSIVFDYYRIKDVAVLLNVSPRFISCMRRKGNPAPIPFYLFLKLMVIKNALMSEQEEIEDIF